jgi:hypothetical protein
MLETQIFHNAICHWWISKKNSKGNVSQGGTRGENLAGKTMDGFEKIIREFLADLGVKPEHIFGGAHLSKAPSIIPSLFRPSKNWDLVVIGNSRFHSSAEDTGPTTLYAAIEFKSQDKSIGNNQNNRLEESLGNAFDFWKTYEASGFVRLQPRPWLGYLFVGKYSPEADDKPVKVKQPHFLAMQPFRGEGNDENETFKGPSYATRYLMFLRQSVGARLYDAGSFVVSDEDIRDSDPNHRILDPDFGPANFLRGLKAHILAHYPGSAVRPGSLADLL